MEASGVWPVQGRRTNETVYQSPHYLSAGLRFCPASRDALNLVLHRAQNHATQLPDSLHETTSETRRRESCMRKARAKKHALGLAQRANLARGAIPQIRIVSIVSNRCSNKEMETPMRSYKIQVILAWTSISQEVSSAVSGVKAFNSILYKGPQTRNKTKTYAKNRQKSRKCRTIPDNPDHLTSFV